MSRSSVDPLRDSGRLSKSDPPPSPPEQMSVARIFRPLPRAGLQLSRSVAGISSFHPSAAGRMPFVQSLRDVRRFSSSGPERTGDWPTDLDFKECRQPMELFGRWFQLIQKTKEEPLPETMILSTAEVMELEEQKVVVIPNARAVLMKQHDDGGFVFCTNRNSVKAQEIAENPNAALTFHWKSLDLQVRVRGLVSMIPAAESDLHWKNRPRGSQLSAVASEQSEEISSHEEMLQRKKNAENEYADAPEVPRPPHWGGYRVAPVEMEFWEGTQDRLHKRHLFRYMPEEDFAEDDPLQFAASDFGATDGGNPAAAAAAEGDVQDGDAEMQTGEDDDDDHGSSGMKEIDPIALGTAIKISAEKKNPFVTGFDPSDPKEIQKRQLRAERFQIPVFYHGMRKHVEQYGLDPVEEAEAMVRRAEKFGVVDFEIDVDGPEKEHYMMDFTSARRYDTVHLYGTKLALENVKSNHIMEFYAVYGAKHIEWLSAVRCNIVFADPGGARRAMMFTSSPLPRKPEQDTEIMKRLDTLGAKPHDIEYLCWRVCQSHSPNSSLLCRIATVMDVKESLEERRKSKYYKIYWQQNLDELMQKKRRAEERSALMGRTAERKKKTIILRGKRFSEDDSPGEEEEMNSEDEDGLDRWQSTESDGKEAEEEEQIPRKPKLVVRGRGMSRLHRKPYMDLERSGGRSRHTHRQERKKITLRGRRD